MKQKLQVIPKVLFKVTSKSLFLLTTQTGFFNIYDSFRHTHTHTHTHTQTYIYRVAQKEHMFFK